MILGRVLQKPPYIRMIRRELQLIDALLGRSFEHGRNLSRGRSGPFSAGADQRRLHFPVRRDEKGTENERDEDGNQQRQTPPQRMKSQRIATGKKAEHPQGGLSEE